MLHVNCVSNRLQMIMINAWKIVKKHQEVKNVFILQGLLHKIFMTTSFRVFHAISCQ
jgi:hypothetical protein